MGRLGDPVMLLFGIELAAVVALIAILAWQPETHGRHIRRLVVVLWGRTAFGAIHTIAEYVAMIIFSERDWNDLPAYQGRDVVGPGARPGRLSKVDWRS
jgi:hypothetical protein